MLSVPSPETAKRILAHLTEYRFDEDGLRAAPFGEEMPAPEVRSHFRLRDLTEEPTPLNTLVRLFRFGWEVESARTRSALAADLLDSCIECGLLEERDSKFSSPVMLAPFGPLLIASDHARYVTSKDVSDAVLMINATTRLLSAFATRKPTGSALELFSGNGAIGLTLAATCKSVVLTDLSKRARSLGVFSAALNGIRHAEYLQGNRFQPVEGRRFDLIVANPPFYITPGYDYMCINNDLGLDNFCRQVLGEAPRYLNEGGWLQMLFEWVEIEGESWQDRIRQWLEGSGCDTWLVKGSTTTPDRYARDRIAESYSRNLDQEADGQRYIEWMTYYRNHRVVNIHRGLIAMRRREGENWMRIEESPRVPNTPFGDGFLAGAAALDFLAATPKDEGMLATRFVVAEGVKLTQQHEFRNGELTLDFMNIDTSVGIRHTQKVDSSIVTLLLRMNGQRTLGELAKEAASKSGSSEATIAAEAVAISRRLLERGFLRALTN
jgi:hypothetical protein